MNRLVDLLCVASKIRGRSDDDFADRLSSRYTVDLLVVFAILVTMNQYVRNPITCWAPAHFSGAHTKFTTQYCWVKNTYYLQWEEEVPKGDAENNRQMVPYYQWIPIILLVQAVFFYLPSVFWHFLNSKAGVDADNILATAGTLSRIDGGDAHEKTLKILSKHMDRFLGSRIERERCRCGIKCVLATICCRICGRRLGSYLLIIFIISKFLYIANIVGQLFLLNRTLAMRYSTFGFDIIEKMTKVRGAAGAHDWTEDEGYVAFPRVTYCDFNVRGQDLRNTQPYTVQCVLPVNMYNEKIFLFLWFWMAFVAGVSILSFFVWLARAVFRRDRVRFVRNHLRLGGRLELDTGRQEDAEATNLEGELVKKFTDDYLRQDGAFILRLIAHNTDNLTTTDVLCAVWDLWKEANVCSSEEEEAAAGGSLYPETSHLYKQSADI